MRVVRTTSLPLVVAACGLLTLGACGDDGPTGSGTGSETGSDGTVTGNPMTMTTMTTMDSVDTTAGPGTTVEPTSVDTTEGEEESTTTGPPPGELDAFRFTSMEIRDPHFFDTLVCSDITGMVNDQFAGALGMDDPEMPDGLLDLSLALVFRPADQADGIVGDFDFANADCTAPAETTECTLRAGTMLYPSTFVNMADGTCHEADPAHLGGYNPPPSMTTGPCFSSAPADVVITTSFELPLSDAIIAAQYSGDDDLVSGTIRGFLSEADAEAIILPEDLPVVGGGPISAILKDGAGSSVLCSGDDRDGGGWWFYVEFTAERVPWSE